MNWHDVFTSGPFFEIIIRSLDYCIQHKGLHLHGYVIMPNHVHYILSTETGKNLSDVMRDFNTHTSREISGLLKEGKKQIGLREFFQSAIFDGRGNIYKV